jgi:hypothetical protein
MAERKLQSYLAICNYFSFSSAQVSHEGETEKQKAQSPTKPCEVANHWQPSPAW